jgi:O-antigen ligase
MFGLGLTKIIPYLVYVGVFAVAITALFRPKFGVICTMCLLPFRVVIQRLHEFPLGKDAVDILFMCIIGGLLFAAFKGDQVWQSKSPLLKKVMIVEIAFLVFSLFVGAAFHGLGNPIDTGDQRFLNLKNHLMLPILFLLTFQVIENKRDVQIIVFLMILALFVADLKYFNDNRFRVFSSFSWDYKEAGIFKLLGGNVLAAFKAYMVFLPLSMFFYERQLVLRLFYLGTAAFTFYPIMFLFSRGAYVAVFLGLCYLGWKTNKLILVGLVLVAVFWTTMLPVAVVERIEMTREDGGELDASAESRLDLWRTCFSLFLKSPLFGVGYDTFDLNSHRDDPHNTYMEILAEQGIVGITLFLLMLVLTYASGAWLQKYSSDPFFKGLGLAACLMVIACAVTNLFGDRWSYMEPSALFFVMMAVASKAKLMLMRDAARENEAVEPNARELGADDESTATC